MFIEKNEENAEIAKSLVRTWSNFTQATSLDIIAGIGSCIALSKHSKYQDLLSSSARYVSEMYLKRSGITSLEISEFCQIRPDDRILEETVSTIDSIDDLNHADLFEEVLQLFFDARMRNSDMQCQPKELTHLANYFVKEAGANIIYNPFAGMASYQIDNPEVSYYSQEINRQLVSVAKLRLFIHDITSTCHQGNSLFDWQGKSEAFDAIIATPPFRLRLPEDMHSEMQSESGISHRTSDTWFLEKSIQAVKRDGVVVSVVPTALLFSGMGSERQLRQYLVENGYLQTVVALPRNILPSTSISTAIVVLSKKKNSTVTFVDAQECFIKGNRLNKLDYEKIIDLITVDNSEKSKIIPIDLIIKNDFDLDPSSYFSTEETLPDGFSTVSVEDVAQHVRSEYVSEIPQEGFFLRASHMAKDSLYCRVELSKESLTRDARTYRKISEKVLLLSSLHTLNPTIVEATPEKPIYVSHSVMALRVDETHIYMPYLAYELALRAKSRQDFRQRYLIQDILNQKIPVPIHSSLKDVLSHEKSIIDNLIIVDKKAKIEAQGLQEIIDIQKQEFLNEIRIKKHSLSQHLFKINGSILFLQNYLKNQGYSDEVMSARRGLTVEQLIESLLCTMKAIDSNLEKLTEEQQYGVDEIFDLNDHLQKIQRGEKYNVKYTSDLNDTNGKAFVKLAKDDLDNVVSSIITNAVRHGFIDESITYYTLLIDLRYDDIDNMYVIEFSNNGKPMPAGMDTQRYGIKGESAGESANDGIGGYHVKNIVEHAGGSIEVVNAPSEIFPVTITIKLPRYEQDETI